MAFTYTEATSDVGNADYLSAIRSTIQDTVSTEAEFTDAEITAQYGATDSDDAQAVRNLTAAVKLARLLHRRYAKQASFASQGTSVQLLERAKYWASLVSDLESDLMVAQAADGGTGGILYAGRATSFEDQIGINLGMGGSLGGYLV